MEMVKYLAMMAVVVGSLVLANVAEAGRRHHGCASCGGCAGGVCAMPVGVAPAPVKAAVVAPEGTTVVAATPAPVYTTARRGLFGWRR